MVYMSAKSDVDVLSFECWLIVAGKREAVEAMVTRSATWRGDRLRVWMRHRE